ncbi:site-specific DNA-methyltransferase [Sphingomonas sp. Leaf17]|uniref:site-specific DNA-methyltransferase n=1 Tax=Sphingomonas sp. Leaf17 TaxID=1735683 RepID=UPI0009E9B3AF|nr:DNA methyltransferase [Sphingomonas sp. Leaf17]
MKSIFGSNKAAAAGQWEMVAVATLTPAMRRTRTHSGKKRQLLETSIREYGMLDPITVNSANVIVDGHLRFEIAQKLGFRDVPVIRISHLSNAEERAYAIAANKLPTVANYDVDALRIELEEIRTEVPTLDLTLTGFTVGEMDRLDGRYRAGLYDDLDEDTPDSEDGPEARLGDLYALGNHKIICGDSLEPAVYEALMGTEQASCCFTDPPYNVKIQGHVTSSAKHGEFAMASGEMTQGEFECFLSTVLGNVRQQLTDGAIAFVCMDHGHLLELLLAGDAVFSERLNICMWDKGRGGMGSLYRSQHECIAVFKNGAAPHLNNIALGKNGRDRTNVWSFPGMIGFGKARTKARALHPTVKPVVLMAEALLDVTSSGDRVLDPFGGSGSTLIAAERIGRHARLIELDPTYVDRTIARWERLTGRKAELLHREPEGCDETEHMTELG